MKRTEIAPWQVARAAGDWRKGVRRVVEDLVGSLGDHGEPLDAIAGKVVRAAREALSAAPSRRLIAAMVESVGASDGTGPYLEPAFPGLLRGELDSSGWPWDTPVGAESVMDLVQRSLADLLRGPVPPYWAACLELAARAVSAREFRASEPCDRGDRAALLARVMGLAWDSLHDNSGDAADATPWDGGPIGLGEWLELPSLFRYLTRSLDRRDPEVVAVFLAIIQAAACDELVRQVPGRGPGFWV